MKDGPNLITHIRHEERETEARPLDWRLLTRLFYFTRPYARKRNLLFVMVILRAIQLPLLAWMIGAIVGGPISRMDLRGVALGTAGYALLVVATQVTMYFRFRYALELGEEVIRDLRMAIFRHIQKMPISFFHNTRLGRIISRFTSDSEAVRTGVQNILFVTMIQTGQMIIAAGFMLWYDSVLFLIVLVMSPMLWGLTQYFRKRLSAAYRATQESFSRITATLAESVNGIRVTQGFVREDLNAGLFHELVLDHSRYNLDAAKAAGIFLPLLEFNTQFFIAVVLFVGGWRVLNGQSEIANLYQFLLMAGMFFAPIQALGNQYNSALAAMAGGERVFNMLDTPPEWTDPPNAVKLADVTGRVEFKGITFAYKPNQPVLHDINFAAEPGQITALVGHTGSGKSSIINLIAKFYLPTSGELLLDGRDIRTIDTDSLHRRMGIVLQENFLFTGTVLDNMLVGNPRASREDVVKAAQRLDCLDLIALLPDGLNTVVGERGAGISLGQRQLICFTRAMLADPRILVLDEATSSVDTMTEVRIQTALERLLSNRTSFVVAHRLSTIRHAHQVLVLDQGRIVERGTHEELLVRGEVYADLYRQFIGATEDTPPQPSQAA